MHSTTSPAPMHYRGSATLQPPRTFRSNSVAKQMKMFDHNHNIYGTNKRKSHHYLAFDDICEFQVSYFSTYVATYVLRRYLAKGLWRLICAAIIAWKWLNLQWRTGENYFILPQSIESRQIWNDKSRKSRTLKIKMWIVERFWVKIEMILRAT